MIFALLNGRKEKRRRFSFVEIFLFLTLRLRIIITTEANHSSRSNDREKKRKKKKKKKNNNRSIIDCFSFHLTSDLNLSSPSCTMSFAVLNQSDFFSLSLSLFFQVIRHLKGENEYIRVLM